jgi:hypothetical protein
MFPKYKNLGRYYVVGRNQYPGGFRAYAHKEFESTFYHRGLNYEAWKDGNARYQISSPSEKYYYN